MSNATIRVQFRGADAGSAGAHLSAELDDRPAGLNSGKTGFVGGDSAFFLVYKSSNVEIVAADCSAGSVSKHADAVTVTKTEDLNFEDEDSAQLPVPAHAITASKWLGRNLGAITLQADKQTIKAVSRGVGVLRVTYQAQPMAYRLDSPVKVAGETDFSILVLITGEVTDAG